MSHVMVYLVGAGPGDPGLLTRKAADVLGLADCVIYDYLASPQVLALASADAEKVYVGKKGFAKHIGQEGINDILVEKARALAAQGGDDDARIIVRLKGGDPFVFGRGGEEALALAEAGVAYQVVPGVTSGIAAPAYAGIPVTHRGIASSVTFVTGNEDPEKETSDVDWPALAALIAAGNTVCFYMGVRNLEAICGHLAEQGAPADTPVSLVEWGTMPRQRFVGATLATAAAEAQSHNVKAPAMIVVGNVGQLSSQLSWREDPPLAGKRIVVTRASAQSGRVASLLQDLGAEPIEVPLIAFEEADDPLVLQQAVADLGTFDWVVFTSANGVEWFFRVLYASQASVRDARALAGMRIAAIGPATASALNKHGICADVVPEHYIAEAVFDALCAEGLTAGDRVLIPRAQEAREVLPDMLEKAGADVCVAPAYRTVVPADAPAQLAQAAADGWDAILFTSSSTARHFMKAIEDQDIVRDASWQAFSIGPVTTFTLRQAGWENICQADVYTIDGMVDAMKAFYCTEEK